MHKKKLYSVLNNLKIEIEERENPFGFNIEDLFEVGARMNPKRSFLFISKLLGKHLEVNPDIPKVAGHLLSNLFLKNEEGFYFSDILTLVNAIRKVDQCKNSRYEITRSTSLKEQVLFIGFAETATGLGHAVASLFDNAHYVHTTRENFINKKSLFDFEEEHSHATEHFCYLEDRSVIDEVSHIVLIDDEITTGKTCLNLIKALNDVYPGKRYTILTLLDWRTDKHELEYEKFYMQYGVNVTVLSLLRGNLEIVSEDRFEENLEDNILQELDSEFSTIIKRFPNKSFIDNDIRYRISHTGRFGVNSEQTKELESICKETGEYLKGFRKGKRTLCIGNEELIYIPSRIASYMGDNVYFKSSTRSPIYVDENYIIKDRISYKNDRGIINYIYNLKDSSYDEVFMFFEDRPTEKLLKRISGEFKLKGIHDVKFILL